jgi:secondary thiamine-phosphate synthase enzyme
MECISIKSKARTELIDITGQIQQTVASAGVSDGLAFIYVPHTTAGLTINEGADPAVRRDIISVLNEIQVITGGIRDTGDFRRQAVVSRDMAEDILL